MDQIHRLKPMTLPVQTARANTIYVDTDTEQIKVGTGASGSSERILGDSTLGFLAPDGTASAPSYSFASATTYGLAYASGMLFVANGSTAARLTASSLDLASTWALQWGSSGVGTPDVSLSRGAANRLDLASGDSFRIVNGYLQLGAHGSFTNVADGVFVMANNAGTGFTRLILGTNDTSGIAIKLDSGSVRMREGDDSADADLIARNVSSTGFFLPAVSAAITASTTQTQGQQPLTAEINNVSTCANANDVVTLPAAEAGKQCIIFNNGAQQLQIFPASGDNLGAGVDASATLAAGSNRRYVAFNTTDWEIV